MVPSQPTQDPSLAALCVVQPAHQSQRLLHLKDSHSVPTALERKKPSLKTMYSYITLDTAQAGETQRGAPPPLSTALHTHSSNPTGDSHQQ